MIRVKHGKLGRLILRTCLAAGLLVSIISCTHMTGGLNDFQPVERGSALPAEYRDAPGCFEEDIDALETAGLKRFVLKPVSADGNLFADRGVMGEPVRAQSGERLEIWWEGFFPRYRLYYFPSGEHPGVVIGECRFPDGCNSGFFFAPDGDADGVPDSFSLIQWTNIDYGRDEGIPGYLDRYRYIYDVPGDRFYLWHDLLKYRCPPPLSFPPDTCRTVCEHPYETRVVKGRTYPRVFKIRLLENKRLLGGSR